GGGGGGWLGGRRYRTPQPRPGGRHPAREGRQTGRRPPRELVDGRTGPGLAPGSRCPEVEGSPRPGDAGIDARLRPAAGGSGRPHNRSPPATRGALGYRRLGGQGRAHPDRAGTRLGEVSRGCGGAVRAGDEWAGVAVRVRGGVRRKGSVWGDGITEKVIWHVVKASAAAAGIAKLSPHDCRRTCARLCHAAGGELEQIQFLLGHVSVETTERYLGCKQRLR